MEKFDDLLKSSHPETYQIKVTLLECRQLALGTDEVPSPYIVLKVGDQVRETLVITENPDPIYNAVFDFRIITTESELKTMKILISVMNKTRWYQRDTWIGSVSIDAWTVFNKNNHMIHKAWAVLNKEGVSEPGYLNYSIIVSGSSDKLLALRGDNEEEENEQEGEGEAKKAEKVASLVPGLPPIEKKSYLMTINLYQGDFCEVPWIKEFSSKVKIIVSEGKVTESSVISNSRTPGWKEQYNIPMRSPFAMTFIVIEIWIMQGGEKLYGRFVLDFGQLYKDGSLNTRWNMIYGPERENSLMKKLKYNYGFGKEVEHHFYFGRILVSAKWVPDDNPAPTKYPTPDVQYPEERPYIFWLDVYELTSTILSSGDQIFIECQVADRIISSKKPAHYNSALTKFQWKDKEIRFKEIVLNLPCDPTQIPDIFIRIKKQGGMFSDDEYIAYCRFKPQELINHRANVKAKWQKLRMCRTQVKSDGDANYLGLLLCSINFFPKPDGQQPRPIVVETKNFKKYKLISIIYMANDLPILDKGSLPSPIVEISFNGNTRRTMVQKENNNPIFGEIMFISTYLNDCLDLSDNIRMEVINKGLFSKTLGKTEIEVSKIQKYNSQTYIDAELYKSAKWYHLYEGTKKMKAKVLAAFLIVKLTKQGREDIIIDERTKKIWPEEEAYRLYLFILGVRGVPRGLNLHEGCVMAYMNRKALEALEHKDETFNKPSGVSYDNNLNVYDSIGDPGENGVPYKKINLSKQKEFVIPMSLVVMKEKSSLLTANVDLTNFFEDAERPLSGAEQQKKLKLDKKNKMKKLTFNPMPEDFIPLYYREGMSEVERTKENTDNYTKIINRFPFEQEESNAFVGSEITINIYNPEYDKKGNLKKDDDLGGSFNRPDIDYEFEDELDEKDLPFCTSSLQMSGEAEGEANYGIIRYLLKLVKDDDIDKVREVEREFKKIKEDLNIYKEIKSKTFFICRVYLLNTSNLTIDDGSAEEFFVWIKRYENDREWKDKKKTFQVSSGEINQCYSMQVIYPETFFITIQVHAIKKIIGLFENEELIGETHIDLERRYFNSSYKKKLENYKTFKQIPVESRTLQRGNQARGAVRMWVELLEKHREQELLPERLVAQAMDRYELRLIIWNTRDIPLIDGGKVDILVKVLFNDYDKDVEQETDVHSDSKDGHGQFNWRIVVPFKYPHNKPMITISVFDNNMIGSNDMISSNVINIKKYLNRIHRTKTAVEFPRDWLPLKLSAVAASKGSFTTGGEVELEFKILTFQEAESNKVGRGRDEPNKDPFLDTPKEGRSFLDKFSGLKDILSGLGGLYDGLFRWLKIFGIIISIAIVAYIISIFAQM